MLPRIVNEDKEFTVAVGDEINIVLKTRYASIISQTAYYLPDGTRKSGLPAGLEKKIDYTERTLTLSGAPTEAGDYKLLISLTGLNSEKVTDTLTIRRHCAVCCDRVATDNQTASVRHPWPQVHQYRKRPLPCEKRH